MLSHRKIKALLLLFMIMLVMPVYSQVITGKVIDANNKEPIIGASIQVKGTSIGTMSDLDGQFKITVKDKNASLQVSYVGYKTVVQPLNGRLLLRLLYRNRLKSWIRSWLSVMEYRKKAI